MAHELSVLVVDDDPEFLAYVRDGLHASVQVARTPLEALWLLEHTPLRAVVCDLRFGDIDGRHVLDLVRDRWPSLTRILVTGYSSALETPSSDAMSAAQAVIYKPCDLAVLQQLLDAAQTSAPAAPH